MLPKAVRGCNTGSGEKCPAGQAFDLSRGGGGPVLGGGGMGRQDGAGRRGGNDELREVRKRGGECSPQRDTEVHGGGDGDLERDEWENGEGWRLKMRPLGASERGENSHQDAEAQRQGREEMATTNHANGTKERDGGEGL